MKLSSPATDLSLAPRQNGDLPVAHDGLINGIRQGANALFEMRGGHSGQDLEDWLQAEQRVLASQPKDGIAAEQTESASPAQGWKV